MHHINIILNDHQWKKSIAILKGQEEVRGSTLIISIWLVHRSVLHSDAASCFRAGLQHPFLNMFPSHSLILLMLMISYSSRGDLPSMRTMTTCLDNFVSIAGLLTDRMKSRIDMAKIDEQTKANLLHLTSFQGDFLFKYLKILLATEKLKVFDYCPPVDSLIRRINSWKKNIISYAQKLQLISSILQGV